MAKYLLFLPLLLLSLLRTSDALAQSCYCTTPWYTNGTGTYTQYCTANADCWACQPGAYNTAWQQSFCPAYRAPTCSPSSESQISACPSGYNGTITSTRTSTCPDPYGAPVWGGWAQTSNNCVSTCQPVTETQTLSCPVNYSGSIIQTRTKTCPDNQWQAWQTTSNTCTPNPPTCQVTTESQTLACPTGYTGSIIQIRSSTCPNPYGQPVIAPWTTSTNTCVKSVSNPTNVTSPVSPVSPTNPTSVVSPTATAVTTPTATTGATAVSAPQQMQTPQDVSAPAVEVPATPAASSSTSATETKQETKQETQSTPTSSATSSAPTAGASATQPSAKGSAKETPTAGAKPKLSIGGLNTALTLDIFVKPGIIQPNVFPTLNIGQELPLELRQNHQFLMELLSGYLPDQSGMFNRMAKDAIELEQ